MKMKYFKQHFGSCNHEWTEYGCYQEEDITEDGDILASVYSFDCDEGKYSYDSYQNYLEPDEITEITEEENKYVIEQLKKVEALQLQIDEIIKTLIK